MKRAWLTFLMAGLIVAACEPAPEQPPATEPAAEPVPPPVAPPAPIQPTDTNGVVVPDTMPMNGPADTAPMNGTPDTTR